MHDTHLQVRLETITPAVARRYLATQHKNRRVKLSHVSTLTRAMEDGTFLLSGDPIRFNAAGELMDGQHRLLACIASEMPLQALVIRGLDADVIDVIDTGIKRTPGDIFSLRGFKDATNLAAVLKWLWRFDHTFYTSYPYAPQIQALEATMERHPAVKDSLAVGYQVLRLMPKSLACALYTLFQEHYRRDAAQFFTQLASGEGLFRGDPVHTLRTLLVKNSTRKAKLPYYEIAAVVIKAFNAYTKGKKVHSLRWASRGENPEAFPTIDEPGPIGSPHRAAPTEKGA